jgi:hypothetical protein
MRQVLGRTVFAGLWVVLGTVLAVVLVAIWGPGSPWAYLVFLPLIATGTFIGLTELGHNDGVDASAYGLTWVMRRPSADGFVPWSQVVEIRTERRGWRTVVVIARTAGDQWRLRAPYDGRWLSHDPQFEPKLFNLRNLWETYRTWKLSTGPSRPETAGGGGSATPTRPQAP